MENWRVRRAWILTDFVGWLGDGHAEGGAEPGDGDAGDGRRSARVQRERGGRRLLAGFCGQREVRKEAPFERSARGAKRKSLSVRLRFVPIR